MEDNHNAGVLRTCVIDALTVSLNVYIITIACHFFETVACHTFPATTAV
jgi:hypothetical protein